MVYAICVLICVLILLFGPLGGFTKRGGYMNFQFLCYQNPDHLDYLGDVCDTIPSRNCDPYFIICISNKMITEESSSNCPVYYHISKTYYNEESVCNTPSDNRDSLGTIPDIELPYPLQETYYIKIIVKDSDRFSAHQTIATFVSSFRNTPSPNFKNFVNKEIFMIRQEQRFRNPRARITISIGLKCDWNLYGNLCMTFCRSQKSDTYTCSSQGKKVCKQGWQGEHCLEKDLCRSFLCAKGASCIVIEKEPRCTCNGIIGPECYPDYDPCRPNPCNNGGQCAIDRIISGGTSCKCAFPYYGSRCQVKFNVCQMDPCRNNGTCHILRNGSHICKCLANYEGPLCEQRIATRFSIDPRTRTAVAVVNEKKINIGVIFGTLFGLCMIVMAMVGLYFLVRWRLRQSFTVDKDKALTVKHLPKKSPSNNPSNDYGIDSNESVYDTIDDKATYACQEEDNDDYLIPSRTATPAFSTGGQSRHSENVPMYEKDSVFDFDNVTSNNTKVNEYLADLPTRTPKKKLLHQIFNFQR